MNKLLTMALLSGAMLCNAATINAAPSYTFTNLSPNAPTGAANAINNLGQITGFQSVPVPIPGQPGTLASSVATVWDGVTGSGKHLTTPDFSFRSIANDLNDSGQVVGFTADNFGNYNAMLWENGQTKPLPSLDAAFGMAQSINGSGQIVGITGPDFGSRITQWDNDLTPATKGNSMGFEYSINNSGEIAGVFEFSPANFKAGILSANGALTDIGTLGESSDKPLDINNHDVVVGYGFTLTHNIRAFSYDGDTMTALRMIPGYGGSTVANAINELDQVVGYSSAAGGAFQHATLWNGFEVYDLNDFLDASSKDAGWVLTNAFDINDHGWIVGEAENTITGRTHAFLFSSDNPIPPIPEPHTYIMFLVGLGLLGFMVRKNG